MLTCYKLRLYFTKEIKEHSAKYLTEVIKSIQKSLILLEFKLYFFDVFIDWIDFEQAGDFLKTIELDLDDSTKKSLIVVNANPFKLLVILLYIIKKIRRYYTYYSI
jgi:hypothetical protein